MTRVSGALALPRVQALLLAAGLALLCVLVALGSIGVVHMLAGAGAPAGGLAQAPAAAQVAFNLAPLLYAMAHLAAQPPDHGRRVTRGLLVALPGAAGIVLATGYIVAPVAGMACVGLAYALWNWRRLAAAARPPAPDDPDRRGVPAGVAGVLDVLPIAALIVDRQGTVVAGNRLAGALAGGADPDSLRGQAMQALLAGMSGGPGHPEPPTWDALRAPQAAQAAQAGPGHAGLTAAIEWAARAGQRHAARCAALAVADGSPAGWLVTIADLSALRAAERVRDDLMRFLSHDLRSPQSSILALLELHAIDPDDNPLEEVHRRIDQYARRTLRMSEQVLHLARAESRQITPAAEDLGAIVEEAVDEVWAAAGQSGTRIEVRHDGEALPVLADRPLLVRAVVNLLAEAVEFSPQKAAVTVTLTRRQIDGAPRLVCAVADQGPGLSPETRAQLFQCHHGATQQDKQGQGTGPGMAFVKAIVEKHGGTLDAAGHPGEGSIFTIVLAALAETEGSETTRP